MMNTRTNVEQFGNTFGTIAIVLNKAHFYPGEQITGKILLRLYMDFPLKEMSVQFKGIEKLSDMKSGNQAAPLKKELFSYSSKLLQQGYGQEFNVLKAGKHIFPFKCSLHFNAPGTYNVFDGRIRGKIVHKIVCRIENISNPQQSIVCKERVNVRELLDVQPQQQFSAEIYKTIYSCFGCTNQRECRIMSSFDRQFYSSGETGILSILVHNESNLDIASFSVTLWNVYSKKTQVTEATKHPSAQFDSQNQLILFKQAIREQIYEGVKANTKETQLNNNFQFVNYNSNQPLPPSVKGTFTANYYYVEIKAHFEGCSTQPLILQVPVSLVLSSQQPPRTMLEIQQGIMSKSRQRDQEKEVILQEFNEMSHYHINHNEIEVSAVQNLYDLRNSVQGVQVSSQQQNYQFGNTQYDQNNSYQQLVDSPQKYIIPGRQNEDLIRYTTYKNQLSAQQNSQTPQQTNYNIQPRSSFQNQQGSNNNIRLNLSHQEGNYQHEQNAYQPKQNYQQFQHNNYTLVDQTPKFNQ